MSLTDKFKQASSQKAPAQEGIMSGEYDDTLVSREMPHEITAEYILRQVEEWRRGQKDRDEKKISGDKVFTHFPLPKNDIGEKLPGKDEKLPESIGGIKQNEGQETGTNGPLSQIIKRTKEGMSDIITNGYQSWDNIMNILKDIQKDPAQSNELPDPKGLLDLIKNLPVVEQAKVVGGFYMDVALDMQNKFKEVSQDLIKKGVNMSKTLYDMKPQERFQLLSDIQKEGGIIAKDVIGSIKEFYDMPMEDKIALYKDAGKLGIDMAKMGIDKTKTAVKETGKTLAQGAKKFYDAMTSR